MGGDLWEEGHQETLSSELCLSKLFYYMNLFHVSERKIVQVHLVFLFQLTVQVTEPNHSDCCHLFVGFAFIKTPNMMSRCSEGHICSPFVHSNNSMVPVNYFLTMWNVEEFRIPIIETLNVLVQYVQGMWYRKFSFPSSHKVDLVQIGLSVILMGCPTC